MEVQRSYLKDDRENIEADKVTTQRGRKTQYFNTSAPLSSTLALSLDIMYPEQLDIMAALTTELRPTPLLHHLEPHWYHYHEAFLSPS